MLVGLWGLSVPLAYIFAFRWPDDGIGLVGVWWGLVAGYAAMTLAMTFFVLRSDWDFYAEQAQLRSEMEATRLPCEDPSSYEGGVGGV